MLKYESHGHGEMRILQLILNQTLQMLCSLVQHGSEVSNRSHTVDLHQCLQIAGFLFILFTNVFLIQMSHQAQEYHLVLSNTSCRETFIYLEFNIPCSPCSSFLVIFLSYKYFKIINTRYCGTTLMSCILTIISIMFYDSNYFFLSAFSLPLSLQVHLT